MKYIYLTLALFISMSSYSQEDLLGEWFLNSITYNEAQLDNYLNIGPDVALNLNFTEIIENEEEILISFDGTSSCNPFQGTYKIEGSALRIIDFAALTGPCFGVIRDRYEEKYMSIIANYGANSGETLDYTITGTGSNAILVIANANGDFAVYGKTPIYETIFRTWNLTSINDNGETTLIPSTDSPNLNLTTSNDAFSRILFEGVGDCNSFSGFYSIYATDDNALTIFEFNPSLVSCSSPYEPLYFDIFSNPSTNYLTYELVDEGQTLILTDLSNRKLFFGSQPVTQVILGEWFLHYFEVDGVEQYSTIPNSSNYITFNDETLEGSVCSNGYGGTYTLIDNNTFNITGFAAFAGNCNYPIESQLFLEPYLWEILSDGNASSTFSYVISGLGNNQTLIITNNNNNNSAFYGRAPLPENKLPGVWYLHSITKNDVEEMNTFNTTFDIDFTLNQALIYGLNFSGSAICNDYSGAYYLSGEDTLKFNSFGFTLMMCQQNGAAFEDSYFSFFSAAQSETQLLTYNVTGSDDDESLILTSQNGDFVTYGRQPLSFPDNDLVNRWYLQYVNVDGEQFDNFYNTAGESLNLDLTNIVESPSDNTLFYQGSSSCNGFGGGYSYNESTLTFENMAITLADCQGDPRAIYENYYLHHILRSDNTLPSTLNYTLTESGINQTLTLTGSSGDFAVFGKIAPTTQFFRTWYLSSIESNGSILEIPETEMPTINLTSTRAQPIFPGITFNGQGDCNAFDGDYLMYFNNTNTIKINNFSSESTSCSSNYETEYFDILNDADTNQFSFELLDSNSALRLTDLDGNKLMYSDQALSVSENIINLKAIRLKENPVKVELHLELNKVLGNRLSYQIYSVDGKKIMESQILEQHSINVDKLTSGLYFLVISSEDNFKQTLKFIKK